MQTQLQAVTLKQLETYLLEGEPPCLAQSLLQGLGNRLQVKQEQCEPGWRWKLVLSTG